MENNFRLPGTAVPPERAVEAATARTTRRSLLIRMSALMGVCILPGVAACGNGGSGGNQLAPQGAGSVPPLPSPAENPDVRADVSFGSVPTAAPIDSRFAGLSYEKTKLAVPMFTAANTPLIQLFGLLGPSVLRIGANAVDRSSWDGAIDDLTPILPSQIDALAEFVQATQWQVMYGVNLARNTPARAADEAAYVAERLGSALLAWEIGNEPDLYRRHDYRPNDWGYDDYLEEWREFHAAMSEAAPGVAFSGPATSFDLERNTLRFARDAREYLAMLTHHYYRAGRDDPSSTLALLLEPDPALESELESLVRAASEASLSMGVRLAEANSFYGGGLSGASNAYGSALWVMDFMFNCALAGCSGVNMHGGNRGPYTPIADREGMVVETRAVFYGMLMFAQAAQGLPLEGTVATQADVNFSAWGVQRDDGGLNAILINKDDQRSVGAHLATGISADHFTPLWLRGEGLFTTSGFTLGDVPIGEDGSWTPQPRPLVTGSSGLLDVLVPPSTAVLLRSQ